MLHVCEKPPLVLLVDRQPEPARFFRPEIPEKSRFLRLFYSSNSSSVFRADEEEGGVEHNLESLVKDSEAAGGRDEGAW